MLEKEIAKLYGTLQFKADYRPLLVFKQSLVKTDSELKRLMKSLDLVQAKIKRLGSGSNVAQATKIFQAQQTAAIKNGKLFATMETQRLAAIKKEAAARKVVDSADTSAAKNQLSIRREAARLAEAQRLTARRDQIHGIRTTQAQARLLAIQAAEEHRHNSRQSQLQRTQQRLHTNISNGHQSITSGLTSLAASSGFGGGIGGGLTSFASNLSTGSMAVSGFSALVIAAGAALKGYADAVTDTTQKRLNTRAQFAAVDTDDPTSGKRAESRFYKLANKLGLNAAETAPEYTKMQQTLKVAGLKEDQRDHVADSILSYAKGSNLSSDDVGRVNKVISQIMGKNQFMSEEVKGQLGEVLPLAVGYLAEAWAEQNKTGLKGQEAYTALFKDMESGKAKGASVNPTIMRLMDKLKEHANDGGRLDQAMQSHQSSLNRRQNIYDASYESANYAGKSLTGKLGAMDVARKDLDRQMEYLAEDMKEIMDKAGESAGHLLEYLALGADALDRLIQLGNGNKGAFDDLFSKPEEIENFHKLVGQVSGLFDNIGAAIDKINEATGTVGFSPEFKSTLQEIEAISNAIAETWKFITDKLTRATKMRDQKLMDAKAEGREATTYELNKATVQGISGFGADPKDMSNDAYQAMLEQRPKTFAENIGNAMNNPTLLSNVAGLAVTQSMQLQGVQDSLFVGQQKLTQERLDDKGNPVGVMAPDKAPNVYNITVEPANIKVEAGTDPVAFAREYAAAQTDSWTNAIARLSANQKELE